MQARVALTEAAAIDQAAAAEDITRAELVRLALSEFLVSRGYPTDVIAVSRHQLRLAL